MKQQINLFQTDLIIGRQQPAILNYLYGLILLVVILSIFSVTLLFNINSTQAEISSTRQRLQQAQIKVKLLQVQYPKKQINTLLANKIQQSQDMQTSLERIIRLLTDKTSDQTQGFSRYLSAFARQTLPNLWLSNIVIDAQTKSLRFSGSTYTPQNLPVLLQKLQSEAIFQGKIFVKLQMKQSEDKEFSNKTDFIISTRDETQEGTP